VKTLNQKIGQNGASAVEFAIVLPLLVVLVFGIIEFSICFYNKAMLTNASREGSRAGIVFAEPRVSDAEIESVVDTYCGNNLITFGAAGPSPDVTVSRSGTGSGDALTVTVDYHYDFLVLPNFISALIGGLDLSAVTIMRME
jgi:Flp pilus assembly protein TadG